MLDRVKAKMGGQVPLFDWIIGYCQEVMGERIGKLTLNTRLTNLVFILHEILRLFRLLSRVVTSSEPKFLFFFFLILFIFDCAGSSKFLGFSVVVVIRGYSSSSYTGFSLHWLLLLQSMGFRVLSLQ